MSSLTVVRVCMAAALSAVAMQCHGLTAGRSRRSVKIAPAPAGLALVAPQARPISSTSPVPQIDMSLILEMSEISGVPAERMKTIASEMSATGVPPERMRAILEVVLAEKPSKFDVLDARMFSTLWVLARKGKAAEARGDVETANKMWRRYCEAFMQYSGRQ